MKLNLVILYNPVTWRLIRRELYWVGEADVRTLEKVIQVKADRVHFEFDRFSSFPTFHDKGLEYDFHGADGPYRILLTTLGREQFEPRKGTHPCQ
jgi:hypothetical protein